MCLFDGVSPRRSEVAGFSLFVFTEPPPLCIYYGRKVTHRTRRVAASCPGGLDPRLHPAPHSLILCFQSTGSGCTRAAPDELKSRNLSRLAPKKFAKDQKKNLSRPETKRASAAAAADSNNGARWHPGLKSTARLSPKPNRGKREPLGETERTSSE